jgi:hypothetical protein
MELTMPAEYVDIPAYHRHEASRHYALAQAARDQGDFGKAKDLVEMAARHAEAAQAREMAIMTDPGPSIASQTDSVWPPEQRRTPFAATRLVAVLRRAGHLATALRESRSRKNPPFNGLFLH